MKPRMLTFALLILSLLILGCAGSQPKKEILIPAQKIEPKPPEGPVIEVPEVHPMPKEVKKKVPVRQLVKVEKFVERGRQKYERPAKVIDRANQRAAQKPTEDRYINAMAVYDYMEGALYQVYCSPLHTTDIMLQPGEELTTVPAAGDTIRWMVAQTASGTGKKKQVHILVKPVAPGLHTNIVIATDRHIYHLEAQSYRRTYQAAVSWRYPKDHLEQMRQLTKAANEEQEDIIAGVNLGDLNFDYKIEGKAPWKPLRVFDDGAKTYIEFPKKVQQGELPPLFIVSHEKKAQIVNYRYSKNYYVVDRLFAKALLQIGEKRPQKVYLINKGRTQI